MSRNFLRVNGEIPRVILRGLSGRVAGGSLVADADVAELAYAQDLGSCGATLGGSTPSVRTDDTIGENFGFPVGEVTRE